MTRSLQYKNDNKSRGFDNLTLSTVPRLLCTRFTSRRPTLRSVLLRRVLTFFQKLLSELWVVKLHLGHHVAWNKAATAVRLAKKESVRVPITIDLYKKVLE